MTSTGSAPSPAEVSADSGFCSEANLADLAARGIRGYVATGRAKHPDGGEEQRRPFSPRPGHEHASVRARHHRSDHGRVRRDPPALGTPQLGDRLQSPPLPGRV